MVNRDLETKAKFHVFGGIIRPLARHPVHIFTRIFADT